LAYPADGMAPLQPGGPDDRRTHRQASLAVPNYRQCRRISTSLLVVGDAAGRS